MGNEKVFQGTGDIKDKVEGNLCYLENQKMKC